MVVAVVLTLSGPTRRFQPAGKQYPDVAPPQISVSATFPARMRKPWANTVACRSRRR
jgi:HAE1 family hydrophobic/amphiphilic exporter-1